MTQPSGSEKRGLTGRLVLVPRAVNVRARGNVQSAGFEPQRFFAPGSPNWSNILNARVKILGAEQPQGRRQYKLSGSAVSWLQIYRMQGEFFW